MGGGVPMMEVSYFDRSVSAQEALDKLRHSPVANVLDVWGADSVELVGVCDLREGGAHSLGFCASLDIDQCESSLSGCLIITQDKVRVADVRNCYVQVNDARGAFIWLLRELLKNYRVQPNTSAMSPELLISPKALVHPSAVLEPGIRLDSDVVVEAGCVIKSGTQIGRGTVVRENTVIGCDGIIFYRALNGDRLKFPHLCGVIIGEDVEIGANCVIPRGVLTSTRIGNGVIIGNLCNIGHGVVIEDNVWMSVGSLIGGHALVEAGATLGMGVKVRDNRNIGVEASVGMGSVVVKDVEAGTSVFGNPAKRMPSLSTGPKR